MIYKIFPILLLSLISLTTNKKNTTAPKLLASITTETTVSKVESVYSHLKSNNIALPQLESFEAAFKGFTALKEKDILQKDILTLIDFSLSSNTKRLWVIDMKNFTVLYHSLVAHGRNTGEEYAENFSNTSESYKSSLGFYLTGEVYQGKHGTSLRLDGLEKGINDNARNRAVVIHGADYVSDSFIKNNGRLGRSQGCPALPVDISDEIIKLIKDKSCLYIYHPTRSGKISKALVS